MGYETWFSGELTITPALTPEQRKELHEYSEMRHGSNEQDPDPKAPGIWCDWKVDEGGETIAPEDGKNYDYVGWLEYITEKFFEPWGVRLNGQVYWKGEEDDDAGYIVVVDSRVRIANAKVSFVFADNGTVFDPAWAD